MKVSATQVDALRIMARRPAGTAWTSGATQGVFVAHNTAASLDRLGLARHNSTFSEVAITAAGSALLAELDEAS